MVSPNHVQRLLPSTVEGFHTEHLQLRSVLVQISRGLIKSQLVGERQFSKIRGFSVNPDAASPLNISCPSIHRVPPYGPYVSVLFSLNLVAYANLMSILVVSA